MEKSMGKLAENVRNRLPEAFLEEMERLLGAEEFVQYLESFGREWNRGLRVNERKISGEEFCKRCPGELKKVSWIGNGYVYDSSWTASKDVDYYAGLYYLQEPSAMTPASLLPVNPGDRVLDLCAAPGGKATELGVKLKGEGVLFANDISNSRAMALLKNLELFGIPNICVSSETPQRLAEALPEFFDKILVDAPCSGEGMFRREPGMVQDWLEKGPGYYQGIQREILLETVKMLKPGGYLLYSTCTFSVGENEENVKFLLEKNGEMELVPLPGFAGAADGIGLSGVIRLFPHRIDGEGHFAALLRKRGGGEKEDRGRGDRGKTEGGRIDRAKAEEESRKIESIRVSMGSGERGEVRAETRSGEREGTRAETRRGGRAEREAGRKGKGKESARGKTGGQGKKDAAQNPEAWEEFRKDLRLVLEDSRIWEIQDKLYYLPEDFPRQLRLRFLRTGLLLGELKKGRFEPSQALAMSLREEEFCRSICFSREDDRVMRYLKGETVTLKEDEEEIKGWCLVCLEGGFPLGWAKGMGKMLKNKYYSGWRYQG